jgi:hypothetical protein
VRHVSTASCSSLGLASLNQPSPNTWSSDAGLSSLRTWRLRYRQPLAFPFFSVQPLNQLSVTEPILQCVLRTVRAVIDGSDYAERSYRRRLQ